MIIFQLIQNDKFLENRHNQTSYNNSNEKKASIESTNELEVRKLPFCNHKEKYFFFKTVSNLLAK